MVPNVSFRWNQPVTPSSAVKVTSRQKSLSLMSVPFGFYCVQLLFKAHTGFLWAKGQLNFLYRCNKVEVIKVGFRISLIQDSVWEDWHDSHLEGLGFCFFETAERRGSGVRWATGFCPLRGLSPSLNVSIWVGCRWSCCRVAIRHLPACEAHIFSVLPSFDTTTARECPKNKDGQEQRRRGLTRLVWSWLFLHRLLLGVWVYGSKLPNKRNLCICRLPCLPKKWKELFFWKIDLRK